MALGDSGESDGQEIDQPDPAGFDMQFVPNLPGGRACFPAERDGKFVWLVADGAMTEQCFTEMRSYLCHIVGSGMWTQNWDGPHRPT